MVKKFSNVAYERPIYYFNLKVPFRLVTCELVQDVTLCVLCGPNPSLMELQPLLQKSWKNALNLMYSVTSIIPRKFPPFQIDKTILG